jgi:hypothetical protein
LYNHHESTEQHSPSTFWHCFRLSVVILQNYDKDRVDENGASSTMQCTPNAIKPILNHYYSATLNENAEGIWLIPRTAA